MRLRSKIFSYAGDPIPQQIEYFRTWDGDVEKGRRAYPFIASVGSELFLINRTKLNWFQRGKWRLMQERGPKES